MRAQPSSLVGAGALALAALLGCGPPDPCAKVVSASAPDAVQIWADAPGVAPCLRRWASKRPAQAEQLAGALLERCSDRPGAAQAVLDVLTVKPISKEGAALLAEAGELSLARGADDTAQAALERAVGALDPGPARDRAGGQLAGLWARREDWPRAADAALAIVRAGTPRPEDIERGARALVKADRGREAAELCGDLARSDRAPLTLACVRGAADSIEPGRARGMAMGALAQYPVLTWAQVKTLAPILVQKSSLYVCLQAYPPGCGSEGHPLYALGHNEPELDTAVAHRLVTGATTPRERYCYLGVAAHDCLSELRRKGSCPDIRSLARFVQAMSVACPDEVSGFLERVFFEKEDAYATLRKAWYYRDLEERSRKSLEAKEILYNMHLALAFVFDTGKFEPGRGASSTASYQIQHARTFWRELHPGEQLPDGIPESLLRFLR